MKPPAFDYSRPESLGEALELLAELGPDGKVLAGGQSLLPILSMRLAAPRHLVDINRITELDHITAADGGVRIGALARHSRVLRDAVTASVQPLVPAALALVAHPTIRNRGTTVGSIVHADPSAEMPAVLALLGGTVTLASTAGRRDVAAADFFLGPLESDVRPGELAVEVLVPGLGPRSGVAIAEISRRHGDYAVCGVAAVVEVDDDQRVSAARVAYLSMAAVPVVMDLSESLRGRSIDTANTADAVADALTADAVEAAVSELEPEADIHASADYRQHLARSLTRRVLGEAARSAALRSAALRSAALGSAALGSAEEGQA